MKTYAVRLAGSEWGEVARALEYAARAQVDDAVLMRLRDRLIAQVQSARRAR